MRQDLKSFQKDFTQEDFSNNFIQNIIPAGKLKSSKNALDIYKLGYYCRLTEALGELYEAIWSVLGDKAFFRVCKEYISLHKSTFYNLTDYGKNFPKFLENISEFAYFKFLPDLARFERVFSDLFHSKQHASLSPSELAILIESKDDLVFKFGSAVKLFKSPYLVYPIWKTRKDNKKLLNSFNSDSYLVLYKQNKKIYIESLDKASFSFLEKLIKSKKLPECLDLSDLDPIKISNIFNLIARAGLVESTQGPIIFP